MNLGTPERAAHSADRSRTCCSLGTSPVNRSQKRPEGFQRSSPNSISMNLTNLLEEALPHLELLVAASGILGSGANLSANLALMSFSNSLGTYSFASESNSFF
jgi:hypothetical protein